jgi:hypothetical protein
MTGNVKYEKDLRLLTEIRESVDGIWALVESMQQKN